MLVGSRMKINCILASERPERKHDRKSITPSEVITPKLPTVADYKGDV